jgi:hypothetical protein
MFLSGVRISLLEPNLILTWITLINNQEVIMSANSEKVKKWRKKIKERMVEAMGGKCQCCGYDRAHSALAFHHLDPTIKDFGFGSIIARPQSWEKIVAELRKCILVCHNCHFEFHAGMLQLPKKFAVFNEDYAVYTERGKVCGNKF